MVGFYHGLSAQLFWLMQLAVCRMRQSALLLHLYGLLDSLNGMVAMKSGGIRLQLLFCLAGSHILSEV